MIRRRCLRPPALAAILLASGFSVGRAAPQPQPPVFATAESEHFTLAFDPERDWVLEQPALEALEAGYEAAAGWLGERPSSKVRVEIAPSAEYFAQASGLARQEIENAGVVGAGDADRIVLLSPRLLARGFAWRDALNHEYLRRLLAGPGAGRAPFWLQAGVARYGESRWRSASPELLDDVDRSLVARALREQSLLPLSAIGPAIVRHPSRSAVRLAFAQCALAVEYLIAGWQVDGLRRVLAESGGSPAPRPADTVFLAAIGETFASFEDGWRRSLQRRDLRELAGVVVPGHHLAGSGDAAAWDLAEWQPLAAQNHLRLGDLLRARGNARAALMEYERARSVAPASPYAHVKTARCLLELGRAADAAAAARAAVRLGGGYPAAYGALAAALTRLGEHEGAVTALRGALELNPFDPFVWRDLGRALRKLGRAQEAQQASVAALRLMPNNEAFMRSVVQDE